MTTKDRLESAAKCMRAAEGYLFPARPEVAIVWGLMGVIHLSHVTDVAERAERIVREIEGRE